MPENIEATGASVTVITPQGMRGLQLSAERCVSTARAIISNEYREADPRTREQAMTTSPVRFVVQAAMQNAAERAHGMPSQAEMVDIILSATAGATSGLIQGLNLQNFGPEMRGYIIDMARMAMEGTIAAILLAGADCGDEANG